MGVLPSMAPDMVVTTADTAECMITTTGQDTMMFRLATECMPPASTRTPLALAGGIGMADTAWDTEDTAEDMVDTADTEDTVDTAWGDMAWDTVEWDTADTADTAWDTELLTKQ